MGKVISTVAAVVISLLVNGVPVAGAESGQDAVARVYFDSGKSQLRPKDKAELQHFFQTYETGPQSRIFVVGYTDARGEKTRNHDLSLQRAQAVRREIIRALGIDAGIVMALAEGAGSPMADNRNSRGRALNRRVEIYLASARQRVPARVYGPKDPMLPEIQNLTRQAEACIQQRRLDEAMQLLSKAHALGGDHYAQWHTAWGVAGYYGDAPLEQSRAHLATALRLDPFDNRAREYLGRTEARQKVRLKEITPAMGRSIDAAIAVTTTSQQYEYLHLFGVEPLMHAELDDQPVARWRCREKNGAPVDYYFDHSRVHRWAFEPAPADRSAAATPEAATAQTPVVTGHAAAASGPTAALAGGTTPHTIWESSVFR
jgi:tetratricopeptide (TPR) repeat protein